MSFGILRSTFHKVIGCELEERDSHPGQDKDFCIWYRFQTGSQAYFASYSLGTNGTQGSCQFTRLVPWLRTRGALPLPRKFLWSGA